jgi:hypothetical protein
LRVFSPAGYYWRGLFRTPNALYFGGTELVFAACHFDETAHAGDYYSEFDDPTVEEVLLYAALTLSIGWDGGAVSLYPHPWTEKLPELLNLANPKVTDQLGEHILGSEIVPSWQLMTDPPPPQCQGGPPYQFRKAPMPLALQSELLQLADPTDHVLVRGLGALLKGRMLLQHQMFALEALYSFYVAMDASFSLICRRLREQGVKNPSALDAGAYLNEAEGRAYEDYPYFDDFYADRVRTLHPENRYGVSAYAPVTNCDAHTLFESLREVFRLLILGEAVDPNNHEEVRA